MRLVDSVLQLVSIDRRWKVEEHEWKASGQFPDEVARNYPTERYRHKDCLRLETLGYRQVHKERAPRFEAGGTGGDRFMGRGGAGTITRVVYRREVDLPVTGSVSASDKVGQESV